MQTCLVQVQRQLDHSLHLHVVLEEAAAERGLVVGHARLVLDGRLVSARGLVVRPVCHQVRLLAAEEGAKGPVTVPASVRHAVRKHPLHWQRVAAHGVELLDLSSGLVNLMQILCKPNLTLAGLRDPT